MLMLLDKEHVEMFVGVGSWTLCSVGMMVFNKAAIESFPFECTLVAMQMGFCALVMLACCWRSIHIGSMRDLLRWSRVVPIYSCMLLTSILALKDAPMTLVVTFRVLSPLLSLFIERLYPNPLRISRGVIASIILMVIGTIMYIDRMPRAHFKSVQWVLLNILFGTADRLLQRLMLAKDQSPVDISKTGVTLINNLLGMLPLLAAAWFKGELGQAPASLMQLPPRDLYLISASCVVGVGISYCGIWAQSLISATSFLVLVNSNKFVIIFMEVFLVHSRMLQRQQVFGAVVTILGGAAYGMAREAVEQQAQREAKLRASAPEVKAQAEIVPLIAKNV
eukprot:CAMPEP_0204581318 /NCGR_PEP_ID=MMETSP0661-20131031/44570_1 /ASSEMBLY_ACC=CAM_ASM_000606 /TAXON_ID=109239 /ORGANISM="Alexandrium margalefi, Strain AMGDE01CS-322" /LENGTH=335 /DNA_ID=CAMNT_0051590487 /DNA_START=40 /DNA_END=1047 /DNA_ORIENTATION=+